MSDVTQHTPGTFCWADLRTTDGPGAKKFYVDLFGWTFEDQPMGDAGVYTMYSKNGKSVCASSQMSPEMSKQTPPHWGSYVSVANADDAAAKAAELGGKVVAPAFDVFDAGRMAVIQDPTGAIVSVWQPKAHIGAQVVNEPGTLCWNELMTRDTAAAASFYTGLFGWTTKVGPSPTGGEYTEFKNGERPAGGMMAIQEAMGPIPPHWAIYFAVESCDGTIDKTIALGGEIVFPAMDIPNVGRIAFLKDPQGAVFAIVQLLPGAMG